LKALQNNWGDTFAIASSKQNRTSADVQAKDDARTVYEKELRSFVAQWLSFNTKVSNSDRERMGLTVKSGTRTAVPKPTTCPVGAVDFSARLQHTIHYADEASPRSKAKPAGVHGCEIWMKPGGSAPVEASELTFLATATRTPYIITFDGADAGKTVYYWLRWVNTRSEHGPWGSAISAMVAG
ncbi:MAG TPA: hypothetical protein DCG75_11445, partial [Bacteroidales bacterium]|nr:hypothetical protein [Bacteroidales bacterium]